MRRRSPRLVSDKHDVCLRVFVGDSLQFVYVCEDSCLPFAAAEDGWDYMVVVLAQATECNLSCKRGKISSKEVAFMRAGEVLCRCPVSEKDTVRSVFDKLQLKGALPRGCVRIMLLEVKTGADGSDQSVRLSEA